MTATATGVGPTRLDASAAVRARLCSAPKRHFCDPSLAAVALQATPSRLLRDLNYFGFLFGSLVVRDLRVYAHHVGANVFYYRDNIGEVDVVICDGTRWGAFEVKLAITYVEEAATTLKKFVERIDTEQLGQPAFRGVVVPTRFGYTRDDGIQVIPVQALAPRSKASLALGHSLGHMRVTKSICDRRCRPRDQVRARFCPRRPLH